MRIGTALGSLVAIFFLGCHEPTGITSGPITAVHQAASTRLTNASASPVYYFMVERHTAALINWAPCVATTCASVPGGGSAMVPDSQVTGLNGQSRELILYWWRLVPSPGGGVVFDSIRSAIVPL